MGKVFVMPSAVERREKEGYKRTGTTGYMLGGEWIEMEEPEKKQSNSPKKPEEEHNGKGQA